MEVTFKLCEKCGKHGRFEGDELTSPEVVCKTIGYNILLDGFWAGFFTQDQVNILVVAVKISTLPERVARVEPTIYNAVRIWNARLLSSPFLVDKLKTECLTDCVDVKSPESKVILTNYAKIDNAHRN